MWTVEAVRSEANLGLGVLVAMVCVSEAQTCAYGGDGVLSILATPSDFALPCVPTHQKGSLHSDPWQLSLVI